VVSPWLPEDDRFDAEKLGVIGFFEKVLVWSVSGGYVFRAISILVDDGFRGM